MKNGLKKSLVLGTVGGAAFSLASVIGVGTASAATTLNYNCSYPLIGSRSLQVEITTNLPSKIGVEQETGTIQTSWTAKLGADTTSGLRAVDAVTIEGSASATATVTSPDNPGGIPVNIDNALQKTNIPASGGFEIKGYGEAVSIGFLNKGKAVATLGDLNLRVTLRKADGTSSALGTFDAKCTLAPGQSGVVAEADIVDGEQPLPQPLPKPNWYPAPNLSEPTGTLNYGFNLTGTSQIKTSNGTVNLTGDIGVAVDGKTGDITGDLKLNKVVNAEMKPLGFLPIKVDVDFEQVGKTVGKYANGEISTTSTMYIKLPKVALMGIPISAQPGCRTKEPSVIKMASPAGQFFDPKAGGSLKAPNYTISPLENCGFLTAIISPLTAGSGNTIDLTLKPKA